MVGKRESCKSTTQRTMNRKTDNVLARGVAYITWGRDIPVVHMNRNVPSRRKGLSQK